jgi:hypothetical protein
MASNQSAAAPKPLWFDLALSLRPFFLEARYYADADTLWRELDKRGGLECLFYDVRRKHAEARRLASPDGEWLCQRFVWISRLLRWLFIPCCWLETRLHRSRENPPRVFLRIVVELHFELFSILEAMPREA